MVAASSTASTSGSAVPTFKATFLPASFGNSIACYRAAGPSSGESVNGKAGAGGKGKKAASKASSSSSSESPVKFAEFEVLSKARRAVRWLSKIKRKGISAENAVRQFTTETYTVYASLQDIAAGFERGDLLEDADEYDNTVNAVNLRGRYVYHTCSSTHNYSCTTRRIPQAGQIAYYSRFAQLYKDSLSRYLVQISVRILSLSLSC